MLSRKEIGHRIDEAIGERNASDIAKRLGVQRSTLSNYRTGLRMPSAAFVHALAVELGISADTILGIRSRAKVSLPPPPDPATAEDTGLIRRRILGMLAKLEKGDLKKSDREKLEDLERRIAQLEGKRAAG